MAEYESAGPSELVRGSTMDTKRGGPKRPIALWRGICRIPEKIFEDVIVIQTVCLALSRCSTVDFRSF